MRAEMEKEKSDKEIIVAMQLPAKLEDMLLRLDRIETRIGRMQDQRERLARQIDQFWTEAPRRSATSSEVAD